jgi:signal transduction histidine kinase
MSYVSIFESLWKQVQLYEQLEAHDKMQREFINIASHEMRTPTQAILGYAELLERYPEKREEVYTIKKMLRDFKDLLMIY